MAVGRPAHNHRDVMTAGATQFEAVSDLLNGLEQVKQVLAGQRSDLLVHVYEEGYKLQTLAELTGKPAHHTTGIYNNLHARGIDTTLSRKRLRKVPVEAPLHPKLKKLPKGSEELMKAIKTFMDANPEWEYVIEPPA